jgi:hypothetical protein
VVSRAARDQADPLAPAGRRFGNFVWGRTLELGRWRRTIDHAGAAAPGARWEVGGIAKPAALNDQGF